MDLAISTNDSTMYRVAKISNDDNVIKFFVHNIESKESDRYGRFALVMEDGIYLQDEDGCIEISDAREAAEHLSDSVAEAESILNNLMVIAKA